MYINTDFRNRQIGDILTCETGNTRTEHQCTKLNSLSLNFQVS